MTTLNCIEDVLRVGLEDIADCFRIKENLYEKYVEKEIFKDNLLFSLMQKRDYGFIDYKSETPLGGSGTTLNACVLYSLIRHYEIGDVIETGVSGGYYSSFMLAALQHNTFAGNCPGILTSLELSDDKEKVGKLVPENLKIGWDLRMGKSSLDYFISHKNHSAQLYSHDSLHTMSHMLKELKEFQKSKSNNFFVFIDDEKSDNFWNRCIQTGAFKLPGYSVKHISGAESRLNGHLGGFIRFERL
jgi:hypothetical protein